MPEVRADRRPSVVLFMMDQLSARWLEGGNGAACPTPNFDRLRRRGVSFRQAITSNPLCMPARSTLATGLTTRGHGVLQNGHQLDPALPTYMQLLQRAGGEQVGRGKGALHAQTTLRLAAKRQRDNVTT